MEARGQPPMTPQAAPTLGDAAPTGLACFKKALLPGSESPTPGTGIIKEDPSHPGSMWVLEIKLGSSCLYGKHFTN